VRSSVHTSAAGDPVSSISGEATTPDILLRMLIVDNLNLLLQCPA
jgi:hypothetical protein